VDLRLFCNRNWDHSGRIEEMATPAHVHGRSLPNELPTDLSNARVAGIRDVSEAAAADVPAWIHELRMVEYVEEFTANLESF